jgi:hypothetical protein
MNPSQTLPRQGRCLLQLGVALFLFTSFEGFVVPNLASPNLGRSLHMLSGFTGVMFLAMGLTWPMLKLGTTAAKIAFWFLVYSAIATIAGFAIAAWWGAGRLDHTDRRAGSPRQRFAGSGHPGRHVSGCAHRHHFIRADSLGAPRERGAKSHLTWPEAAGGWRSALA